MPPAKKAAPAAKKTAAAVKKHDPQVDETPSPPIEAHDSTLSSRAKDELFADEPRTVDSDDNWVDQTVQDAPVVEDDGAGFEVPVRHESGGPYDEEFLEATEDDADYSVEETNRKDGSA